MKFRELLVRMAEVAHIYGDDEIVVRVAQRDARDTVTTVREVPLSYLLFAGSEPKIAIEEADLNHAQRQLP